MLYQNYKHSASSGNLWFDSPSAFIWRYGFKKWGKDNPRTWMGKASEQAVYAALECQGTPDEAAMVAMNNFDRFSEGEYFPEREMAGGIAKNTLDVLLKIGGKFERKTREAKKVHGLDKMVGYEIDLISSEAGIIDLKATSKMPWAEKAEPKAKWPHTRQVGLYSNLESTGNRMPVNVLYATPKRAALCSIPSDMAELACREVLSAFEQIERWSNHFPTPQEAVKFIPLNVDTFYWDSGEDVIEARKLWQDCARTA